ncbi:hypothetical protein LWI28_008934 [Acer negundo]|uniref:Uncharacterized protein n=1 Tax=Acer negundo TaxID=4023 RepID=A0AAD5NW90_ACENE|nr:hypothetical protein LWI28_008934 [Acer negundo]
MTLLPCLGMRCLDTASLGLVLPKHGIAWACNAKETLLGLMLPKQHSTRVAKDVVKAVKKRLQHNCFFVERNVEIVKKKICK